MAFNVSKWMIRVSIVSVIVSVSLVWIQDNLLIISHLYKFCVRCQYIWQFKIDENNYFHQFSEITFGIEQKNLLTWVKTCTIGKRFSWCRRGFFRRLFVSLHVEKRAKSGYYYINSYIELFWLYVLKISFRLAAFVVMMNAALFWRLFVHFATRGKRF